MAQTAFYSIDEEILNRFNRLVPPAKRSEIVQDLLATHIAAREERIAKAAWLIENDADFAAIKQVTVEMEGLAGETMARLDTYEKG